jgi:hypothetical protein
VTNKYQPRNDFVVFQQRNKGTLRGVAIPDRAAEGKELVVVAVGPMVEDLEVGDLVLVIGQVGQETVALPNERDLYMTRETNVVLIFRPE